jgi:hypothetical protein
MFPSFATDCDRGTEDSYIITIFLSSHCKKTLSAKDEKKEKMVVLHLCCMRVFCFLIKKIYRNSGRFIFSKSAPQIDYLTELERETGIKNENLKRTENTHHFAPLHFNATCTAFASMHYISYSNISIPSL